MMAKRPSTKNLDSRVRQAVAHFWKTRARQDVAQGRGSSERDHGNRTAATGGKQLDGFVNLLRDLLVEAGLPEETIYHGGRSEVTIPGFFRPTKQWDLLVVAEGNLLAAIETKSLCGPSFGNNYNNRVEEALGSSTDIWTAYREGAFDNSPEPFVGYFLLLEESPKSLSPVRVNEKHFSVFEEFRDASYVLRCEQTVRRLVRERCYNSASLLVSRKSSGKKGDFSEPGTDLTFKRFAQSMCGHVTVGYKAIA